MPIDLIHPSLETPTVPSQRPGPSADYSDDRSALFNALFGFPSNRLSVAQQIVGAIAHKAETAMQGSDAVKRLETLRTRFASTTSRVDQIAGQHAQAEKEHFDSLSGDSDAAVSESRAKVLDLAATLDILTRERDALAKLVSDAVASRDEASEDAIEAARADTVANAVEERDAAFERLLSVVTSPQFQRDVEILASRHLVYAAVRDSARYRRNASPFLSSGTFLP